MKLKIPHSIEAEHEELHRELREAIRQGGRTGRAAKGVAALLHPHFEKEEEYALPPLALLRPLAEGRSVGNAAEVLEKTKRLKSELANMLEEHKSIVKALETLIASAKNERKVKVVGFAEKLMLHAENEEEILYPASILVGEYLAVK